MYYNGITGNGDHPELVYRSNFSTSPFPEPRGRYHHVPIKSVHGVYQTSLNKVWGTVGPKIRDLIKQYKVHYSSIDPARFLTHEEGGTTTLGPVTIWIGVHPASTSPNTAHEVSQAILALLAKHGVEDAVVEWREAIVSKLAGPALMRVVGSNNPTAHVRRIFTPALNVPIATEDAQGSLTLFFHEGKDKNGKHSDKVLGVTNCHVLQTNTNDDYEFEGSGAPKRYIRVNGPCRFEKGLDEIRALAGDHGMNAEILTREIIKLEAKEDLDTEDKRELRKSREKLLEHQAAAVELEGFYDEVKNDWGNAGLRNIGHVHYAKAISIDVAGGTMYTEDWGTFEADEAKLRPEFEGSVVDLGAS